RTGKAVPPPARSVDRASRVYRHRPGDRAGSACGPRRGLCQGGDPERAGAGAPVAAGGRRDRLRRRLPRGRRAGRSRLSGISQLPLGLPTARTPMLARMTTFLATATTPHLFWITSRAAGTAALFL